ncbi:MAG TPA: Crp/Fnr family transcriptional regulator [Bacteroidia bacterium]|nr:Crp/Fnr family transcriptional regulator [Bacteroidia bacterium]
MEETYFQHYFKSLPETRVKKGEILLSAGDISSKVYYVQEGCLRSYLIDDNGKEHIYQFAPEDWVISDEEALLQQKPALLFIDAVEDSVVKILNRPANLKEDNVDPETALQILDKFEKKVNSLRSRIIQLLSASAEERYSVFVKTYPNLIQRVPQKMIASYLGITPESLSRVRKEILNKK